MNLAQLNKIFTAILCGVTIAVVVCGAVYLSLKAVDRMPYSHSASGYVYDGKTINDINNP